MKTRTKDCYRIFPHNEDSYQLGDDPTPVSFIQLVKPIQLFPQNKTKTKLPNANKKQKMRKAAGRDAIPPPACSRCPTQRAASHQVAKVIFRWQKIIRWHNSPGSKSHALKRLYTIASKITFKRFKVRYCFFFNFWPSLYILAAFQSKNDN